MPGDTRNVGAILDRVSFLSLSSFGSGGLFGDSLLAGRALFFAA